MISTTKIHGGTTSIAKHSAAFAHGITHLEFGRYYVRPRDRAFVDHEPWQKLGTVTDGIVDRLRRRRDPLADSRFQHLVRHLHALGPRPVAEFLLELVANDTAMMAAVQVSLERYHHLDPSTVKALGGDRFPAIPLHAVSEAGP